MQLRYISERGLSELSKQRLLYGQKTGKLDFYKQCVFEKQCRVKFNTIVHKTKGKVDYMIHSNLWGLS